MGVTGATPGPYVSRLAGINVAVGGGLGLETGFDALASLDARFASARAIMAVELLDDHAALDVYAALPATLDAVASTAPTVVVAAPEETVPSPQPLDVVEAGSLLPLAERTPPAGEIAQALVPAPVPLAPPLSSVLAP